MIFLILTQQSKLVPKWGKTFWPETFANPPEQIEKHMVQSLELIKLSHTHKNDTQTYKLSKCFMYETCNFSEGTRYV